MNKTLKIVSVVGAGVLLLGAGALAGSQVFPKEIAKEVPVNVTGPTVFVDKIVPVEKIVTVDKIVSVEDTAKLDKVMSFVEDNYDEDVTVEYILFETDAKIEAEAYISNNFKSLLKDNDFFDDGATLEDYRTSEVSIKKIADATVLDKDFEDKDLTLEYVLTIKAKEDSEDRQYFDFTITIPFENGKLIEDDVTVEE